MFKNTSFLLISSLISIAAWAETPPTTPKQAAAEIPFEPEKMLLKTNSSLGGLRVLCKQRYLGPEREIVILYRVTQNKQIKVPGLLLQAKNFNSCADYNVKLGKDLNLTMVSSPGERVNEPSATITIFYQWNKSNNRFLEVRKVAYSPFKSVQANYKKAFNQGDLALAEKVIVTERKKIEPILEINVETSHEICEEFNTGYKKNADQLFRQKKYKEAFDLFMTMRQKFGDPQNIFLDSKGKKNSVVIVCQSENSNTDQSEDQFYTFARKYLNKIEYVPFLIKRAQQSLSAKTTAGNELATQILKFTSYVLKAAPNAFQLEQQPDLVKAWGRLAGDNPEHPEFDRVLDEDTHLVFLLAESNSCKGIPPQIFKRLTQKNDNQEILKSMTITAGDDFYTEGLQKSAVYEYKQFVQGRALLKKCDQIPKKVFDRYFKFMRAQPYEN